MMTQNRLNEMLARQKKGLVFDALAVAALVIAVGIAAVMLWLHLPSLAGAYDTGTPSVSTDSPAAVTATMLEQSEDEACRAVQATC